MAWLFAACPWSVLDLEKSTNDGLVALIVVLAMLALNRPFKRGVLVGLGAASKFFPASCCHWSRSDGAMPIRGPSARCWPDS